jgi:hypothetical protein
MPFTLINSVTGEKEDKYKTLAELVKGYGYPFERHFYETEDGYINMCHRISGPRGTKAQAN